MKFLACNFAMVVLIVLNCCGVTNGQSDRVTPQETVRKFCDAYNTACYKEIVPLLTPKTKSTLLMAHAISTGMAPKDQQELTREFDKKWSAEIKKFATSESIDLGSGSQWSAINGLSKWPSLDKYLTELWGAGSTKSVSMNPHYGIATDFVVQGNLAKATVPLSTDGGIIAGLNGNSLKPIDAGSINIFMKNISGKWLVCHENEYNGELEPKGSGNAK